ncbi:ferrous iron transport protein A [Novosphingobium flavum]|uniref:Ferrous iron transport protein A n=1 Tax=Novosphingobium aerophilum TaxID=2839843 RepID=A0A7X1F9X9_9SPHN|nr:FeoA family protein [Novosphingobium aerophilum]MBC2653041.1 ferrous iron transport protein A [Novosphingobium aerophilum]MBC2661036.1 ferrous iron transport protein A [Novosphingobium aerophilum]
MTLDQLPIGQDARIVAVDWGVLVAEEAQRLRALGLDAGALVSVAHRGVFAGRDPLAITVGRMTVALRRVHARAMQVELAQVGPIPVGPA